VLVTAVSLVLWLMVELFDCRSDQTSSTAATAAGTDSVAGDSDPSRSWAWHQSAGPGQSDGTAAAAAAAAAGAGSGVVVYQLPAATSDAAATVSSSGDTQPTACYYSVDAFGQIVQQDSSSVNAAAAATGVAGGQAAATSTGSVRESQLELEVLQLQTALTDKSREVDSLRAQLADAYATVERLKTNSESAIATPTPPPPPVESAMPCVSADLSAAAASDAVLATDVPAAPSPPS